MPQGNARPEMASRYDLANVPRAVFVVEIAHPIFIVTKCGVNLFKLN